MIKILISSLIFLLFIIVPIIKGECNNNLNQPLFTKRSTSIPCTTYEVVTVTNPQSFTSLEMSGSGGNGNGSSIKKEVSLLNNGGLITTTIVFEIQTNGDYNLDYQYYDYDLITRCNGSIPITVLLSGVSYTQPQCPFSAVAINITNTNANTFILNNNNNQVSSSPQLVSYQPGNNNVFAYIPSVSSCRYFFEVLPITNSIPILIITPSTICSSSSGNGILKVVNHQDYSSMSLNLNGVVYTNYSMDGEFMNLTVSTFTLTVESLKCGIQLINGNITQSIPNINIQFNNLYCNISKVLLNFNVNTNNNNTIIYKLNNQIVESPQIISKTTNYKLSWYDTVGGCGGDQTILSPTLELPGTLVSQPEILTLSSSSVVTIKYSGSNFSDLGVITVTGVDTTNGNNQIVQLINNNQFNTIIGINQYAINSPCYQTTTFILPTLKLNYVLNVSINCMTTSSINLINYHQYNNILLNDITNNINITLNDTNNGVFSNLHMGYSYILYATENSVGGIGGGGIYKEIINIPYNMFNNGLVKVIVDNIQLPSTCNQPGSVTVTPIYNNSMNGTTRTFTYSYSTPYYNFRYFDYCPPETVSWFTSKLINITYSISNQTNPIDYNGWINITTYSQVNYYRVNDNTTNIMESSFSLPIGKNTITIYFNDGCSYPFNVIIYGIEMVKPNIKIKEQSSMDCNSGNGEIEVMNKNIYNLLEIDGLESSGFGVWSNVSSNMTLYQLVYSQDGGKYNQSVMIDITTDYSDVNIQFNIVKQPGCQGSNFYEMTDSLINLNVTKMNGTRIPLTQYYLLNNDNSINTQLSSYYYNATNQIFGTLPGTHTSTLISNHCKWNINYTINPIVVDTDSVYKFRVTMINGYNGASLYLDMKDPSIIVDSITTFNGRVDNTNMTRITQLGTSKQYLGRFTYSAVCDQFINSLNLSTLVVTQLQLGIDYYLLPSINTSQQCSTQMIQFTNQSLSKYLIKLDGVAIDPLTGSRDISYGQHNLTFFAFSNLQSYNQIFVVSTPPSLINPQSIFNYKLPSCQSSGDGQINLININSTNQYSYRLYDLNGYSYQFNQSTKSFNNLKSLKYQLRQIILNNTNNDILSLCTITSTTIDMSIQSSVYLVPFIESNMICSNDIKSNVTINTLNNNNPLILNYTIVNSQQQQSSFNSTTFELVPGSYNLSINSMYNNYCTFNQSARMISFNVLQASPITVSKVEPTNNQLCNDIKFKAVGGRSSSNYTFNLYNGNSTTILNSTLSNTIGEITININVDGNYRVDVIDSTGCTSPSSFSFDVKCSIVSSSNQLKSSLIIFLFIFIFLIYNL